jgi:hypothetical protein
MVLAALFLQFSHPNLAAAQIVPSSSSFASQLSHIRSVAISQAKMLGVIQSNEIFAKTDGRMISLRFVSQSKGVNAGVIFMDCSFDGKQTPCELDTGSGRNITVLNNDFFNRYPVIGHAKTGGMSGGLQSVDIIQISDFRVDSIPFGSQRIEREARSRCDNGLSAPVIGWVALASRSLELSFSDKNPHAIIDGRLPRGIFPFKFSMDKDILLPAKVSGQETTAMFDTGAGLTVIDENIIANHPENFMFVEEYPASDINCQTAQTKIYKAKSIEIGNRQFSNVYVLAMDFRFIQGILKLPDLHLIIGTNMITQADWSFDFVHKRWSVAAPSQEMKTSLE